MPADILRERTRNTMSAGRDLFLNFKLDHDTSFGGCRLNISGQMDSGETFQEVFMSSDHVIETKTDGQLLNFGFFKAFLSNNGQFFIDNAEFDFNCAFETNTDLYIGSLLNKGSMSLSAKNVTIEQSISSLFNLGLFANNITNLGTVEAPTLSFKTGDGKLRNRGTISGISVDAEANMIENHNNASMFATNLLRLKAKDSIFCDNSSINAGSADIQTPSFELVNDSLFSSRSNFRFIGDKFIAKNSNFSVDGSLFLAAQMFINDQSFISSGNQVNINGGNIFNSGVIRASKIGVKTTYHPTGFFHNELMRYFGESEGKAAFGAMLNVGTMQSDTIVRMNANRFIMNRSGGKIVSQSGARITAPLLINTEGSLIEQKRADGRSRLTIESKVYNENGIIDIAGNLKIDAESFNNKGGVVSSKNAKIFLGQNLEKHIVDAVKSQEKTVASSHVDKHSSAYETQCASFYHERMLSRAVDPPINTEMV
jgi:adhesin HecA-like repeat protein